MEAQGREPKCLHFPSCTTSGTRPDVKRSRKFPFLLNFSVRTEISPHAHVPEVSDCESLQHLRTHSLSRHSHSSLSLLFSTSHLQCAPLLFLCRASLRSCSLLIICRTLRSAPCIVHFSLPFYYSLSPSVCSISNSCRFMVL
jgi:hypothetical protein